MMKNVKLKMIAPAILTAFGVIAFSNGSVAKDVTITVADINNKLEISIDPYELDMESAADQTITFTLDDPSGVFQFPPGSPHLGIQGLISKSQFQDQRRGPTNLTGPITSIQIDNANTNKCKYAYSIVLYGPSRGADNPKQVKITIDPLIKNDGDPTLLCDN